MAELWVIEHSGFMKDLISFTMKNSNSFDVCSTEIDAVSIKSHNLRVFACEIFKDSKGIAPSIS